MAVANAERIDEIKSFCRGVKKLFSSSGNSAAAGTKLGKKLSSFSCPRSVDLSINHTRQPNSQIQTISTFQWASAAVQQADGEEAEAAEEEEG